MPIDVSRRSNVNVLPRYPLLADLLRNPVVNRVVPSTIKKRIRSFNTYKPRLDPQERNQLIDLFREDILALSQLIDRDLSKWLEKSKI